MAKTRQPTAAKRRQEAEARVAELRANAEAALLEQQVRLLEAPQPVRVPWSEYPGADEFSRWPRHGYERPYLWTSLEDRTEGRYLPIYETEQDLRYLRAQARTFRATFPVAVGALESLTNYVIGPGFEFTVEGPPGWEGMAAEAQDLLDRMLVQNEFLGSLDRTIHADSREDGECFVALYPMDGEVRMELVEPDCIVAPLYPDRLAKHLGCGHKLNFWWHGVHTQFNRMLKRDDYAKPLGYHAVFDKLGEQWDYLPAHRVEHIKRNVGRVGRRGVSDFYVIQRELELEAKLRRNTAEGAAILAAIVMIRQHAEGVQKSTVEGLVSNSSTSSYNKPVEGGSRTTYSEHIRPGTVKDMPHGMQAMLGPLGTLRSPVYMEVDQFLLRVIWSRWNAPEYMSGDASNANYASTLVAEAPFVRAREADQLFYANHFERLIWKGLKLYYDMGRIRAANWQQVAKLTIKVDYPSVATRDKREQADVNKILNEAGILSDRSWASDQGLDFDEELRQGAKKAPPSPSPFGLSDGQGGPFGGRPAFESRDTGELALGAMQRLLEEYGR